MTKNGNILPLICGSGYLLPPKLYFSKKNTNKIGRMEEQGWQGKGVKLYCIYGHFWKGTIAFITAVVGTKWGTKRHLPLKRHAKSGNRPFSGQSPQTLVLACFSYLPKYRFSRPSKALPWRASSLEASSAFSGDTSPWYQQKQGISRHLANIFCTSVVHLWYVLSRSLVQF